MRAVDSRSQKDIKPTGRQQVRHRVVLAIVCGVLYFFIAPILGIDMDAVPHERGAISAGEEYCW